MMKPKTRWWLRILLLVPVLVVGYVVYMLLGVRGTFAPFRSARDAGGSAIVVGADGHRIVGRVYVSGTPRPPAPLVVVLHGDAPFVNPGYQYGVASDLAKAAPGTRVVALMRPGYADAYGAKSDGDRGFASGDNYTPAAIDAVAVAIAALKQRWAAPSVFLLGHSGGSTIAADVAALHPGLVQQLFLVGCPCDVPAFRHHMAVMQSSPVWMLPVDGLSPLQTLDRMDTATVVTAISGANDPIALPDYARAYVAKAKARGMTASMITIAGKGHEIFDEPTVIESVADAVRAAR